MTRKLQLIIFFFCFSILVEAQKYSFDFSTKYEFNAPNSKEIKTREILNYFNTDDFSYYLRILNSKDDYSALLFDLKKNQTHKFDLIKEINNGETSYSFKYTGTRIHPHTSILFGRKRIEYQNLGPNKVGVKIFKNKKAKNPIQQFEFTLKKANKNLFPIARLVMMHSYENFAQINLSQNVIVEKASDICVEKRCSCDFSLLEYKNIDLEIELPKVLKEVIY